MEDNEGRELPLLPACVVGRVVDVQLIGDTGVRRATVTGYDANRNRHSLRFDDNGKERSVVLNKLKHKWIVDGPKEYIRPGERFELAAKRDAVGRTLEVYSPKFDKYYKGKIVDFVEHDNKHKVLFRKGNQEKVLNLQKYKWRYTDLVKGKRNFKSHTLTTSKFIGVRRRSEYTWAAQNESVGFIGSFSSEKEAALAYDVHARRANKPTNFTKEQWTQSDIKKHKEKNLKECRPRKKGLSSKYRYVSFDQRIRRWVAKTGKKNLGSFMTEYHAVLAADAEMRRQGHPDSQLNLPKEHVTDNQIRVWESRNTCNVLRGFNHRKSSQYRGVRCRGQKRDTFEANVSISKVLRGEGRKHSKTMALGNFKSEQEAALAYDRVCRKHGVPERELNFPRNFRLDAYRSFDDECYYCCQETPKNPLATPCNHVFCTGCVDKWFQEDPKCPCCSTLIGSKDSLRPVTLIKLDTRTAQRKKRPREEQETTRSSPRDARASSATKRRVDGQDSPSPRFPIGTRFLKNFKRHGKYEGRITSFDGEFYRVIYPQDSDEEEMIDADFDSREIEILEECNDLREQPSTEIRLN